MQQTPDKSGGFTLVETALALLVIGLAFLSLLGLGRSGLQAVKEADNETRCEVMADAIFETLNIYNQRFAEHARTNDMGQSWAYLWNQAVTTSDYFPFPRVEGMSASQNLYLNVSVNKNIDAYDPSTLSLYDWNPRYRLIINPNSTSGISDSYNTQQVFLFIYPDGDTDSSPFRLFTTIINKEGGI